MNIPNLITCLRGPLALLFLLDNPFYRILAVVLAMMTDSVDGYLARRYGQVSKLGTILDPIMDKFFVGFILGVFLWEGRLNWWESAAFLSRDFAVIFFGIFLFLKGSWHRFEFQSVISGKITTTLQFFVLIALTLQWTVPAYIYFTFIVLGCLFWFELYRLDKPSFRQKTLWKKWIR